MIAITGISDLNARNPHLSDYKEALRVFDGNEPPTHNVVRIETARRRVAFLDYPSFFDEPFPVLRASHLMDLNTGRLRTRRYDEAGNPPVLHRKELLLPPGHPRAKEYAAVTASLERAGVLPGSGRIGFLKEWKARLEDAGIRVFFGSYKNARAEAQALLYSAGEAEGVREACERAAASGLGYLDGEGALYLHTSTVAELPPVLRIYVGCASRLYGDVTGADLLKVHPGSGKLSLMSFDDFEGNPLPRMTERVKVRLREQRVELYEYGPQYEPPFLYMKARYIPGDFPRYEEQREFDRALDGLRLFDFTGHGPPPAQLEEGLATARMTVDGFSLRPAQTIPELDERCGKYLTFRDLIHCGETQSETGLENRPSEIATYNALTKLVSKVLDPVMDYFGGIELTFGFCSRELAGRITGRIAPALDQHGACELNARGKPICPRLGAAADFLVPDESMLEVAQWVVANTPFDRLYYYGDRKPVHISVGPEANGAIVVMTETRSGRRMPRVTSRRRFMGISVSIKISIIL